jgi:hypothetical protein
MIPSAPRRRLLVAPLVAGVLVSVVTAGGLVLFVVGVREDASAWQRDGIALIVPGLGATAVAVLVAVVGLVAVLVDPSGRSAGSRSRAASVTALLALGAGGLTVVGLAARLAAGPLVEAVWRSSDAVVGPATWFGAAAVALVVAALVDRRVLRLAALAATVIALVVAVALAPLLLSPAAMSGALAVCAALLAARARR